MKHIFIIIFIALAGTTCAQSVSARSNELIVDFSDPRNDHSVSMSTIKWATPVDSVTRLNQETISISAEVNSIYGTLSAKLRVKDLKAGKILSEFKVPIVEETKTHVLVERVFTLTKGEFEIEILAENLEGFFVRSTRKVISDFEPPVKKK